MIINLQKGEIRLWLYLSEPLCQHVAADLAKGTNAIAAFARLKHLLAHTTRALKIALHERHLPPEVLIISETPNLDSKVPHWIRQAGAHLANKIAAWAQGHLASYLRANATEFRRVCAAHHDGVTIKITMTRVPGLEILRQMSRGHVPPNVSPTTWLKGEPAFHVSLRPGHTVNRIGG